MVKAGVGCAKAAARLSSLVLMLVCLGPVVLCSSMLEESGKAGGQDNGDAFCLVLWPSRTLLPWSI